MNATQLSLITRSQRRTATTIKLGLGYVLAAAKSEPKEAHKRPDVFEWICDVDGCGQIFLVKDREATRQDRAADAAAEAHYAGLDNAAEYDRCKNW